MTTAGARLTPGFVLLGASRCGTTSLFRALSAHPQAIRPAVNKGVRYFDLNYYRGQNWYQAHFPLAAIAILHRKNPVAFEASGYYIFHPLTASRMATDLPDAKLVVMLRDPVERAYSAWKHESARGFETLGFREALAAENSRLTGEVAKITADPRYESRAHRHQSHRARGEYISQINRFLEYFPRTQLHIMQSEAFFTKPEAEYAKLLDFLSLKQHNPGGFKVHNSRPSSPMPADLRTELSQHYAPLNHKLEALLGESLPWS